MNEDADILPYLDRSPDAFFRVAESLEVDKIHLIGTFPADRYGMGELIDHFGAICDRAAKAGMGCTIEAVPFWELRTFEEAWRIVKGAGRANSGIVFDTWHYVRGGRNDALFAEIPVGDRYCPDCRRRSRLPTWPHNGTRLPVQPRADRRR